MVTDKKIPLFKVFMPRSVEKPLLRTIRSGYVGEGARVKEFESLFEKWLGIKKGVLMTNSGTSALHLALHLCIDNPGDEIITTPMTCIATNAPIVNTKMGKIVWADVDKKTGLIDPQDVERKITKKTKAIIMVHWGGNLCQIDEINKIAKKYNLKTIEDSAHAFGSCYKGRKLGNNTSDFVVYSFQAIKHINTFDGGALICKSIENYQRCKLLRWYGIDRDEKTNDLRCDHALFEAGYKFHMNDVCATVGIEMMKYANKIIEKHRENAYFFDENIKNLKVEIVQENKNVKSSYWLYTLHIKNGGRDKFIEYLNENNIISSKVNPRNDFYPAFKSFRSSLDGANEFYSSECAIPVGWWLKKSDLKKIVKVINLF